MWSTSVPWNTELIQLAHLGVKIVTLFLPCILTSFRPTSQTSHVLRMCVFRCVQTSQQLEPRHIWIRFGYISEIGKWLELRSISCLSCVIVRVTDISTTWVVVTFKSQVKSHSEDDYRSGSRNVSHHLTITQNKQLVRLLQVLAQSAQILGVATSTKFVKFCISGNMELLSQDFSSASTVYCIWETCPRCLYKLVCVRIETAS